MELKTVKDLEGQLTAFEATMKSHADQLEKWDGQMASLSELVTETKAKLDDLGRRNLGDKAADTLLGSIDMGAALTWDSIHKAPTKVQRKGGAWFEHEAPDNSDLVAKFQEVSDQLYILAGAMKMIDASGRIDVNAVRSLKFYRERYAPLKARLADTLTKNAFQVGGSTGDGTDWDPTEFSNRLWEKARLPWALTAVIPSFTMPRSPFLFPVELADLTSYYVAEIGTAPPILGTTSGYIPDGKGSTAITSSKTFTARKHATMAFASKEAEEDLIVAILPYLQMKVAQAIYNGKENAIINGDRTSTHQDADVTSATDVRKSIYGLRYQAINTANSKKDAAGARLDSDANWKDFARGARKLMSDPYKANNAQLVALASGNTAIDIGNCEAWRTLYAVGGVATNQNPEITGFRPDGLGAFIVSEFVRGDVDATGVNAASGNDYTTFIQFYRDAWLLGESRSVRIEVLRERFAEYDVDAVKVSTRFDLQPMLGGRHTVMTHGIPNA